MRPFFKRTRGLNATFSDDLATMAVNRPGCMRARSSEATHKSVSFDETRNTHHKAAANSKYATICWYSKEECFIMRKNAHSYAADIAKSETHRDTSYRRILTNVHQACSRVQEEDDVLMFPEKLQQDFVRCIVNSNTRLGLERSILFPERSQRRRQMMQNAQSVYQVLGPGNMQAEMMRRSMESLSRPNRLFAREMGRALAQMKATEI